MPLAACMILRQCRFQLVKLSRPFGLSLLRLFESFNIIVYVSISSFSSLSFIDMSACSVFIVVCLFRILYFICILLSYFWLLGILNLMMINQSIKLYIYTAPVKVRLLTGASYKYARSNMTVFNNRLNCSREVSSLFRLSGRLFHTVWAETRKLLGPKRTDDDYTL